MPQFHWGGLEYNNEYALLDGSLFKTWWHYAVGAFGPKKSNPLEFPGPNGNGVHLVKLYVSGMFSFMKFVVKILQLTCGLCYFIGFFMSIIVLSESCFDEATDYPSNDIIGETTDTQTQCKACLLYTSPSPRDS